MGLIGLGDGEQLPGPRLTIHTNSTTVVSASLDVYWSTTAETFMIYWMCTFSWFCSNNYYTNKFLAFLVGSLSNFFWIVDLLFWHLNLKSWNWFITNLESHLCLRENEKNTYVLSIWIKFLYQIDWANVKISILILELSSFICLIFYYLRLI